MERDVYVNILYMGFRFEKGRVYNNYWKPWYKNLLIKQILIWREVVTLIKEDKYSEDTNVINRIIHLGKKYKIPSYEINIYSSKICDITSGKSIRISEEEREVIELIELILVELLTMIKNRESKKDVYYLLSGLHNLPRALFCKNKRCYLKCSDAITICIKNISNSNIGYKLLREKLKS